MASEAILNQKKEVVKEIADKMKAAESFVLVDYKGINVEKVTNLRSIARERGIDYRIYKNTFMTFAAKEAGYDDLIPCFEGPTAVAFCNTDVVAPAKLISEFVKDNKLQTLAFKGGVIDRVVMDVETITKIAQLPSKDTLLSKMLGSLNAPITNFARVLGAIKDQKEASA